MVLPRGEAAVAKGTWGAPWLSESDLLSGFWGAIPILVFLRCLGGDVLTARHKNSKFAPDGCDSCFDVVRMLWSSISALKRAYSHLPTRPEW